MTTSRWACESLKELPVTECMVAGEMTVVDDAESGGNIRFVDRTGLVVAGVFADGDELVDLSLSSLNQTSQLENEANR